MKAIHRFKEEKYMLDLNEIRNNIDKIDSQLVELFEERMKLTTEVAEYKIETGKKVLDPAREKAKLESVRILIMFMLLMICLHRLWLTQERISICFLKRWDRH